MHGITDGDNWKQFARALGFSLQDLRTKFGRSSDIFAAIIAEYRRQGGTHSDFLKTLNEVGRDLRVGDSEAQPQQQQTTPASSWMEMISLGWLTGATTTASSITTAPSTSRGYNEEQGECFKMTKLILKLVINRLNWSWKLQENNERKNTLVTQICVLSDA